MKWSYSRVDSYSRCPFLYALRYIGGLKTIPSQDADNALILGSTIHLAIEKGIDAAREYYFGQFNILSDEQINEWTKLESLYPKIMDKLPDGKCEEKLDDLKFIGFIDRLVPTGENTYDIWDYKYSNNIESYLESGQLHLYQYYFEKLNPGKKIGNLYYLFIPKTKIRQKKTETIYEFRRRLTETLATLEIQVVRVPYNPDKVRAFLESTRKITMATDFPKCQSKLCQWCEFQKFCHSDGAIDYEIINRKDNDMITLPENKRKPINQTAKKKIWLYGGPFSGKSTFADKFPDPLFLNTDGNIGNITAPAISIKRIVKMSGRIKEETLPWEVFKAAIEELEKKENTFKTIVVDLLEDLREYCREYMYRKMNVEHESDAGFGKGYDMINTEFLGTIKRLMNLDYENIILISHEDTSKDITKKSGDKLTSIRPNINEKLANKVAGMVDLVGRVIAYSDTDRRLSFKADDVVFGGGRLNIKGQEISLDYNKFLEIYSNDSKTTASRI